jgi:CubicO group peptidase (beta-lactamase class C family)
MNQDSIEALLNRHEPIGLAVAVRKGKESLLACGGQAQRCSHSDNALPVRPQTTFELASCTKLFTGHAISLLEERGLLKTSEPIRKHLSGLSDEVTIEQLLHHTSGLANYFDLLDWRATLCNGDVLQALRGASLDFHPGTRYEYNNSNYVVLATLVEKLSGRPYGVFLHEEVFAPLGMTSTGLFPRLEAARGYREGKLFEEPSYIYGDGSLWTCASDLLKWLDFLPSRFSTPMFQEGKLADGSSTGYGYGIRLSDLYIGHNGRWAGYRTGLWWYKQEGVAVAVLANDADMDTDQLADELVAACL